MNRYPAQAGTMATRCPVCGVWRAAHLVPFGRDTRWEGRCRDDDAAWSVVPEEHR